MSSTQTINENATQVPAAASVDPDGNSWLLQEIKTRLPGRGFSNLDVTTLTELLREAEKSRALNIERARR